MHYALCSSKGDYFAVWHEMENINARLECLILLVH